MPFEVARRNRFRMLGDSAKFIITIKEDVKLLTIFSKCGIWLLAIDIKVNGMSITSNNSLKTFQHKVSLVLHSACSDTTTKLVTLISFSKWKKLNVSFKREVVGAVT